MKYSKGHPILNKVTLTSLKKFLSPIADELIIANIKMPVTIIYSSLEMCGVGYAFLERKLGDHQFYPIGAPQIPQNRLFAEFHSPQTDKMKHELISSIVSVMQTETNICYSGIWHGVRLSLC